MGARRTLAPRPRNSGLWRREAARMPAARSARTHQCQSGGCPPVNL